MIKNIIMAVSLTAAFSADAEICLKDDNRIAANDSKVGRITREGTRSRCTATLISNNCIITTKVCIRTNNRIEFNVPKSIDNEIQRSRPEDTYFIDLATIEYNEDDGVGKHWAVAKVKRNELTQLHPGEVQGYYPVISKKPRKNDPVKIVQFAHTDPDRYEVRSGEVNANPYGYELNFAQSVASGKLVKAGIFLIPEIIYHDVDTTSGAAGAPLINPQTGEVVGVNTHGGCQAGGRNGTNAGTSIWGNKKFKKAIQQCLSN